MPKNTLSIPKETQIVEHAKMLVPTAEELSVLSTTEKIGFKLTHKMNSGANSEWLILKEFTM